MPISFDQLIKGTISTKTRKSDIIVNYMIDRINNTNESVNNDLYSDYSQAIKRIMHYSNSVNPLAYSSKDISGNKKAQPDLKCSLLEDTIEGSKCLFNGSFAPDMPVGTQSYMFIYNSEDDYTNYDEGWSTNNFYIHVILPQPYDTMTDLETGLTIKKGSAISNILADLFDGRVIDDPKYSAYVGNTKLKLTRRTYTRLANTGNAVLYTLFFKAKSLDSRVRI
jgi:hypothetical protein